MKYCPILFNFGSKYSFLTIAENLAASYIYSQSGSTIQLYHSHVDPIWPDGTFKGAQV
jgi:hypothetical protein